jgi:hypothetical protein
MIPELNELCNIPYNIPCSEYHIRCVRCGWPVAKNMMDKDSICGICKEEYKGKK